MVDTLVALAVPGPRLPERVLDPSCGAGGFLLGVLDRLVDLGLDPAAALARVEGRDIDAGAVAATDRVVAAWAARHGIAARSVARRVDALADDRLRADEPAPDLIVGNPPFATPLRSARGHDPATDERAAALRSARPDRLGPYADLAAVHLSVAWDRLAPGGTLLFVLPHSLLGSRDTAGLRAELEPFTSTVWASNERHFDAGVRVWAPVLHRAEPTEPSEVPRTWSDRAADALGLPAAPTGHATLGTRIEATSGFRDEFYALARACRESESAPGPDDLRLCTSGALDPLDLLWGRRPSKLAKVTWQRPIVRLDDLDERRAWVERLRRPKVLVPTQSRVLEPVVDDDGSLVPVTPVLAVWPSAGSGLGLRELAAILLAPPVSAWALRRGFGTALSPDAVKIAARDLVDVPMPTLRKPWMAAADLVAQGPSALARIGELMTEAYGADDGVQAWWERRRPHR